MKSLLPSTKKIGPIVSLKNAAIFVLLLPLVLSVPAFAKDQQLQESLIGESSIKELISECNRLEDTDPEAALKLGAQLLSQLDSEKDPINYAFVSGCMGWAYINKNELKEARKKALVMEQVLINLKEFTEDSIRLARRAGGIYHLMGDRISASENYNLAMKYADEQAVISEQIPILVNLGVLNSELRAHEQAINNYYQALDLMAEIKDFKYQPPVLFNLAATLNGQQRFEEGLGFFQQVETMISDQWPPGRIAQTYLGLAAAHSALNHLSLAQEYGEQAMQILIENNQNDTSFYNAKSLLANVYVRQGKKEQATLYAKEASAFYTSNDNRSVVLGSTNPLLSLASTFERLGMLEEAIEMHKGYKEIEQEMQDSFNQQVMAQMQVRLNDKQEREALVMLKNERVKNQIQLNAAEYKRQLWFITSLIAILVFLMFLYWQFQANRKLKKIAMTDSLTQLGNRRAVLNWMQAKDISNEQGCRLLWLIDLDDFKGVNDKYNHDVGDFALIQIAETLMKLSNDCRFVGRWGGEEFVIITDDIAVTDKEKFSELLLKSIQETEIQTSSVSLSLTASVGVSEIESDVSSGWTDAMSQADKSLYSAKSQGKNCVVFSTSNS